MACAKHEEDVFVMNQYSHFRTKHVVVKMKKEPTRLMRLYEEEIFSEKIPWHQAARLLNKKGRTGGKAERVIA